MYWLFDSLLFNWVCWVWVCVIKRVVGMGGAGPLPPLMNEATLATRQYLVLWSCLGCGWVACVRGSPVVRMGACQ